MAATHRTKSPNGERVRRKCASLSSQPVNVGAKANVPSEIVTSGLGTYLPWGIASKLAKANQLRQGIVLISSSKFCVSSFVPAIGILGKQRVESLFQLTRRESSECAMTQAEFVGTGSGRVGE